MSYGAARHNERMGPTHVQAAQQYFPTYKLDNDRAEVGIKEYELAATALQADQKSLTAAAGLALFFSGTSLTIVGSAGNQDSLQNIALQLGVSAEIVVSAGLMLISAIAIRYFSLLQRSAVYAARKIIVLRRLLGLDYGNIETVLPAERLEGANEPFAIHMFPGWTSIQAIPTLSVVLLSAVAQGLTFAAFRIAFPSSSPWFSFFNGSYSQSAGVVIGLSTILLLVLYRASLREDYENLRLYLGRKLAWLIGCQIKNRVGHVIYRMRLSVFEASRLNIDLKEYYRILVLIEDRRHFQHNGNSLRSAISAIVRRVRFGTKSGASTISHQLVRSNFLKTIGSPFSRKIVEWVLAPWVNTLYSKNEILDLYLCSVRFERNVIGLPAAIRHFFPNHHLGEPLSVAQRFFLIERLSNVTGTFPRKRIEALANILLRSNILSEQNLIEVSEVYRLQAVEKRIKLDGQDTTITRHD